MGIFAGQVPAGPFYTASKKDVEVSFPAGVQPQTLPPYVSTVAPAVGDNINAATPGPFYSATSIQAQPEAFGSNVDFPVNAPPYVSTVTTSDTVGTPGLSGTYNPNRLNEINGLPATTTGKFDGSEHGPAYSSTQPNT